MVVKVGRGCAFSPYAFSLINALYRKEPHPPVELIPFEQGEFETLSPTIAVHYTADKIAAGNY